MGALNPKLARTQGILSQHTTPTPRFKTVSLSEVFAQDVNMIDRMLFEVDPSAGGDDDLEDVDLNDEVDKQHQIQDDCEGAFLSELAAVRLS
ncbi:hypothetical protein L917_11953 [Phytophthora nicotianae]|uniref:Uncharacterized protein n=1 Tax=Phytophthora nicotianae TaxID=4792 RepID=W2KV61_PHYNI|nr:hypothetical protein L917_11953 [Phytophthora nicotianae]